MGSSQSEDWATSRSGSHLDAGGGGRWLERIRVKERDGGRGPDRAQRSGGQTLAETSVVSGARGGGGGIGGDGGQRVVIGARMQHIGSLSEWTFVYICTSVS